MRVRAGGEDENDAFLDLRGATVLASPGTPEGLHPCLPGGRAPRTLTWPLPAGPVLVLGLPGTDAAARDLAFFWDLLGPGDLHGGYLVAAWHDGKRPIAVILADDAAALYTARFEWETELRFRKGRRVERPAYCIRAFFPERVSPAAVTTAIAGRANRFWIDAGRNGERFDVLPRLARHGIVPCVLLPAGAGDVPEAVERRAAPWIHRGVRHLALVPIGFDVSADPIGRHVAHLRSVFDLAELVVIGDEIHVPGAFGTWFPGPVVRDRVTAARGRAAVAAADVPLLFVESWAHVSRTPVPSRPRGRPPELGRLFEGVLVLDGPGATEVLQNAWARADRETEEWEEVLLPLLPRHPLKPRAFLERTAERLGDLDEATRRAVGWLDPLLGRIRSDASSLPRRTVLVPRAPTHVRVDGRLDETAWGFAATLTFPVPDDPRGREATLLAVADGRRLHLALRLPADLPPLPLVLGTSTRSPQPGCGIGDAARRDGGTTRRTAAGRTWEGGLGHFDLAGDAHPTRVFHLWHQPREGNPHRIAALVLGP